MTTWDDCRLTCIHGVTEGLDYHNCSACEERAIREGKEWSIPTKTYIYLKEEETKK